MVLSKALKAKFSSFSSGVASLLALNLHQGKKPLLLWAFVRAPVMATAPACAGPRWSAPLSRNDARVRVCSVCHGLCGALGALFLGGGR